MSSIDGRQDVEAINRVNVGKGFPLWEGCLSVAPESFDFSMDMLHFASFSCAVEQSLSL